MINCGADLVPRDGARRRHINCWKIVIASFDMTGLVVRAPGVVSIRYGNGGYRREASFWSVAITSPGSRSVAQDETSEYFSQADKTMLHLLVDRGLPDGSAMNESAVQIEADIQDCRRVCENFLHLNM